MPGECGSDTCWPGVERRRCALRLRAGGDPAGTAGQRPLGLRGGGGCRVVKVLRLLPRRGGGRRSLALWGKAARARSAECGLMPVRAACRSEKGALASSSSGGGWQRGHGPAPRLPSGRMGPAGLPWEGGGRRLARARRLGGNRQLLGPPGPQPGYPHHLQVLLHSTGSSCGLPHVSSSSHACPRTAQAWSPSCQNGN